MDAHSMYFLFQIDNADPPFPRPAGYWWFGCSQNEGIVPDNNINNDGNVVGNDGGDGGITFPSNDIGDGGIIFPSDDGDGSNNAQGEWQACKEPSF